MKSAEERKREEVATSFWVGGMGGKPSQAVRAAVGSVDRLIGLLDRVTLKAEFCHTGWSESHNGYGPGLSELRGNHALSARKFGSSHWHPPLC